MSRQSFYLILLCAIVSCCCLIQPASANEALTPRDRALIEWFDELGFPDLSKAPFVRVVTSKPGQGRPLDANLPKSSYGFLLRKDRNDFQVLSLDLFDKSYKHSRLEISNRESGSFEFHSLEDYANTVLSRGLVEESGDHFMWRRFGERLSERAEVFVLARACAAHGLNNLAHKLIDVAANIPDHRSTQAIDPDSLKSILEKEIGNSMMWHNILMFAETRYSRADLLQRFRTFCKRYPGSKHAKRAKRMANLLEQMIREDQEHDRRGENLQKDKQAKIKELIFQLRNQNGHQRSQPGSCNILNDPRKDNSPAAQLVEMGFDAVPQLIDALDDERFTRSVGFHRNFYFSHHVLRVGDCAVVILECIAGRNFFRHTYTNAQMIKDNEAAETKLLVQKWWQEIDEKGEKQALIDATIRGDRYAPSQAFRLLQRYPAVALDPIIKGAKASKSRWVRGALVDLAGKINTGAAEEFLKAEMKEAPYLRARLAAAECLIDRGDPTKPLLAMIREWEKLSNATVDRNRRLDEDYEAEDLIRLLATSNRVEAINSLSKYFETNPIDRCVHVLSVLQENVEFIRGDGKDTKTGQEVLKAVEKLLVKALDDTNETNILLTTWNDKEMRSPRICDLAGHVLWLYWKDRYDFDASANLTKRNEQRIKAIKCWQDSNPTR